jgi:hypothetical protein
VDARWKHILQLSHRLGHRRTSATAIRKNKIGNPHVAGQIMQPDSLAVLFEQ